MEFFNPHLYDLANPELWVAAGLFLFLGICVFVGVPKLVADQLDAKAARIQSELDEAARLRAEGFEVFVPHEQFAEQKFMRSDGDSTADEVYAVDLAGVMGANAVLAWLDGTQVDDGTSVEIGIFSRLAAQDPARYKGIIGLSTDMRVARRKGLVPADGINLFVVGAIRASGEVVWSVDEAVAALIRLRDRR